VRGANRGRRRWVTIALIAILVVLVIALVGPRRGAPCPSPLSNGVGAVPMQSLEHALESIPCVSSGRVSYNTRDDVGEQMAALDPIAGPRGDYLAVYSSPIGRSRFRVSLAGSEDLIHWKRLAVLDPDGATMPSLRQIAGAPGYLLAYEKLSARRLHFIRIRYYPTLAALLGGRVGAQIDLPIRFSRYNNGTPAFLAIDWNGGLKRSILTVAFHYETASRSGVPGPDREAIGQLRGFRSWRVSKDSAIDAQLDDDGFAGSHGDRRQFSFGGKLWRVYEAQTVFNEFAAWHVLLYDVSSGRFYPLRLTTATGVRSASFGTPTATILRAPGGTGMALVVTIYVFGSDGAGAGAGELVYYEPLGASNR
jgi:hypothetical protein